MRQQLDAAWGHGPGSGTDTCYATDPTLDLNGMALLAVRKEFCAYTVASEMLPALLSSGMVEELTETAYLQELPRPSVS